MRLTGLLLIALGLWFVWQHDPSAPAPVVEAPPQSVPDRITPVDPDRADAREYAVILERPLFSPQRRPPVEVPPEPRPPASPGIRLSAITISNSVRVAVVRDIESNQTRRIREGDVVGEWLVDKVGRNSVILTAQDQRITIPLFGGD